MKLKNLDKDCKEMSLSEQLFFIETHLPDAWECLHDTAGLAPAVPPKFDDNDEPIKEDDSDESIFKPRT